MADVKDLVVAPIASADARAFVARVHYSGTTTRNSQINLGVFLGARLHGVMQFGPPMDRRKILPLVRGATWESVIELNRMAFDEALPRNSESRALAVAFRMFAAKAPQVKWIVSFADGTQCGDGTIYRASGFLLTAIKPNGQIIERPDGERAIAKSLTNVGYAVRDRWARELGIDIGGAAALSPFLRAGCRPLPGYQFRYIRFLDPAWAERLVPTPIPFDNIPQEARMYRGMRRPVEGSGDHPEMGGSNPTSTLHRDAKIDPGLGALDG